jgi:predicted ATPase
MVRLSTEEWPRLIGREREIQTVLEHCEAERRIITIVGPPGVGKTRLAMEVLSRGQGRFGEPAFVDAASATNQRGLCEATAGVFGEPDPSDGAPLSRVAATLATGVDRLVVLDNVEQIIEVTRAALDVWLAECPDVTFILTSREPLGVGAESRVELSPLRLPDGDEPSGDAVALFVDRASSHANEGTHANEGAWTATDLASIARICRRLDGLPLAIELAAARARIMSPVQIEERLATSWALLSDRRGRRPKRHRTLESALEWSWELLATAEQDALVQCGVFRGGFELDAAEAVFSLDATILLDDVLEGLVTKSLLKTRRGRSGRVRFYTLSVVGAFAASKLDCSGGSRDVRGRHADYFLDWGRAILRRSPEADAGARLTDEHPNLMAAHEHNMERLRENAPRAEWLDRALDIARLFSSRGPFESAKRIVSDVLDVTETGHASSPASSATERAAVGARMIRGSILVKSGRHAEAISELEGAIERARGQMPDLEADGLHRLGWAVAASGNHEGSHACFARALALAPIAPELEGQILSGLAIAKTQLGDSARARELLDRSTTLLRSNGTPDMLATNLMCSGWALVEAGQLEAGEQRAAEAASILERLGAKGDGGNARRILGEAALERGDLDAARLHFDAALELLEAGGRGWLAMHVEAYRGLLLQAAGQPQAARECFSAALATASSGDYRITPLALCYRAGLSCEQDRLEDAARDLQSAAACIDGSKAHDRWEIDCVVDLYRGQLDLAQARAAKKRGDLEEARAREASARARSQQAEEGVDIPPGTADAGVPRVLRSAFVRRAHRALMKQLGASSNELVVGYHGFWMTLPSGERVDLGRRAACRRILWALGRKRLNAPGEGLSLSELFEVGWPGVRAQPKSADWRVYDAMKTLRKLGLASRLCCADGGYFLSPELEVALDQE